MYGGLLNHLSKYVTIDPEKLDLIESCLKYKKIAKKAYLLTEGDICQARYFVISGCLRMYVINDKGSKQILQFAIENWWMSDYQSLENNKPSSYFIQAEEDSELVYISKVAMAELTIKVPEIEHYFRMIMQTAYSATLKKVELLLCRSAEERYNHFNNSFPGFVQRIPQYSLASFLGITPEFLSTLRAKLKKI